MATARVLHLGHGAHLQSEPSVGPRYRGPRRGNADRAPSGWVARLGKFSLTENHPTQHPRARLRRTGRCRTFSGPVTTTGGRDEGFSIPAQRDANRRKAESLGAQVAAEFVDAGESARLTKRPGLQQLLDFVAAHRVTYCIVDKIDRLARNRLDDLDIHRQLINAGVQLVSTTENIDETPSGMLVHGIMSSIAEFYSRNLAT